MREDQITAIRQLKSQGKTIEQIAGQVGVEMGDVQTAVTMLDFMAQETGLGASPLKVVTFDFAHDTPGLVDGLAAYTPKVGDLLLDAWIEVHASWDTAAFADLGTFVGSTTGLLAWMGTPATFFGLGGAGSAVAGELAGAGLVSPANALVLSTAQAISDDTIWNAPGGANPAALVWQTGNYPWALVPARFTDVHPLKVVVSQDATAGGVDPGATTGDATLYLLVVSS